MFLLCIRECSEINNLGIIFYSSVFQMVSCYTCRVASRFGVVHEFFPERTFYVCECRDSSQLISSSNLQLIGGNKSEHVCTSENIMKIYSINCPEWVSSIPDEGSVQKIAESVNIKDILNAF